MIESVKLDWVSQKITITFDDGEVKEYTQATKDQHLVDHPDRIADIIAMGWIS
jgi:hypothetical protein